MTMTAASTKAAMAYIAANSWLAACKPEFRDWMLANLHWQTYEAGDTVSHAGDDTGALYCVADGQVSFVAGVGVADIGAGHFGLPGTWWGHAPLLGGQRLGSVVAVADTICGGVPISLLRGRLKSHPEGWRAIAMGLAALFNQSAGAHADLLIADSERRVAATVLRLGGYRHQMFPAKPPASFACTQEQLAGATALSRNTVGKLLRGFEQARMLDARYGRIAILDPAQLTALISAE